MTKRVETSHRHPLFWLTLGIVFVLFIYLIRSILLPFVLGILTAYFLDPAADRLEKAGLSRSMSTLCITICFFLAIALLSILVIPVVASQFAGLFAALPSYVVEFQQKELPKLSDWMGELPAEQIDSVKTAVANFSGVMVKVAGDFVASIFQSGVAVINILSLILITPVVAFYLLRDWDRMTARLDTLLPRAHAATIEQQLNIIDRTLAGFLRGQMTVSLILIIYYSLGLSLAGLKFGIVIGVMTGLLVIFPYVGWLLGTSTGLAVAFFQFDNYANIGGVLAVFLIGTAMEASFLTPRLVGGKVGLHPVWVIFGMLCGGALFGLVGVLIAVPVTAILGVLLRYALEQYVDSDYYQGEKPLIKS